MRRLKSEALHAALGPALPCVQAAATDPSPAVQAQGMGCIVDFSKCCEHRTEALVTWFSPMSTRTLLIIHGKNSTFPHLA